MTTASTPRETGWLPDLVFTGEKFESGLAFFADELGRITRFSREPADLAKVKRLEGQAALPGLVNGHSRCVRRLGRGRESAEAVIEQLGAEDLYDVARMAFLEMLLSGITCVGEFHALHHQPDGAPWPEPNLLSHALLRAARDTGLRISLFKVAAGGGESNCSTIATAEQFLREMDALREFVGREHPADEAWLGIGADALPAAYLKEISSYAHAKRFRFHASTNAIAVRQLVELGLVDKRLTIVDPDGLSDEDVRALGAARAMVCVCPSSAHHRGIAAVPTAALVAAGADVGLGSGDETTVNLLAEARVVELGTKARERAVARWRAATVTGARSLGAPSGALEVGRPADFFTVNLYDPSIAGASPEGLLDAIVFSLERRAIREVWMSARPRVTGGRHPQQGPIVGRFVELQRRLGR